ncbi:MAG: NAD(P)-binding domain-containing protein [Bacteroidetes bacterium]|nr:NAD(P)-binding domain-containing protein [Bacteroidota bacterium]
MSDTFVIALIGAAVSAVTMIPFIRHKRSLERRTANAEIVAEKYGLKEPASLHPVIDPGICIGTGSCLADVCPEHDVLGLSSGVATVVSPARCIGHGLCERACPVGAIKLVFGTESRGVDIPRIDSNFETNVPGMFIVGELGGMGLIRNAFEQGRQCIEWIARHKVSAPPGVLDVLIVGCGPAGLSASINCIHHGLKFKTIEREEIGGTVRTYPRKKLVMTAPLKIPGYGKLAVREIQKEDLVSIWDGIIEKTGLEVQTNEVVNAVGRRPDGTFEVITNKGEYLAKRVVLAIGRRGVPRKLGIEGETLEKVAYSLREPEAYQGDRIVVVGGGDSAVEAAIALADQPGNKVSLSYRKDRFSRIKQGNHIRIHEAIEKKKVSFLPNSTLTAIHQEQVAVDFSGDVKSMPNDYVFIFAGGVLPTPFLESCGIAIDTKFGQA